MLHNTKAQCKSQKITTVLGDMNSKVSKERDDEIVVKYGMETHNECVEKHAQWCAW